MNFRTVGIYCCIRYTPEPRAVMIPITIPVPGLSVTSIDSVGEGAPHGVPGD